jgi:DNA-directed RNA polymerase subunit beta'
MLGGYVTSPKDFIGKNLKPHPDGLFSQRIFGPIKNYCCECGKLRSKLLDAGKVCDICGVYCGPESLRFKTFGKIKLVFPVLHPLKTDIKKVLGRNNLILLNPLRADSLSLSNERRYIAISSDGNHLKMVNELVNKDNFFPIPFRITGIYSLILCLKYISDVLELPAGKKYYNKDLILNEIRVLPPSVRPVFINTSGNKNIIQTTELNKFYTSILQLNKSNSIFSTTIALDESDWLAKIHFMFQSQILDQDLVESTILEFDSITARYQYYTNNIYSSVLEMLSGKYGLIRSSMLSRTIEFSARSVIVTDPSIDPYQIRVSPNILLKLWNPYFLWYLIHIKNKDPDYCYENYIVRQPETLKEEFNEFLTWFCKDDEYKLDHYDILSNNILRNKKKKRLCLANRQPTLHRHSMPCLEIVPSTDFNDNTIGVNPLLLEPMNADHDGDTFALYILHDTEVLNEIEKNSFLKNYVQYDQNYNFLATLRHESLYSAFILTKDAKIEDHPKLIINSLKDLPEQLEYYNELYFPVQVKDKIYTYGKCLFNKWCNFDDIIIDFQITAKFNNKISEILYKNSINSEDFYDRLNNLQKKLLLFISFTKYVPTINLNEMWNVLDLQSEKLLEKLPNNNPELGYMIFQALVERQIDNFDKNTSLYNLFISGTRFNKTQLARTCIGIGYSADANNIINPSPIRSNLLKGISEDDFFKSSFGTRKSLKDKYSATPASGYLERTMVMALSPVEIVEEDCYDSVGIEILVFSEIFAKTLIGKYFKECIADQWSLLTEDNVYNYINKKIWIRSPMSCKIPNFRICKKCFGEKDIKSKYVGIIAGQVLVERLTQLIMRTFHTSGSAKLQVDSDIIIFIKDHLIDIKNKNDEIILYFDAKPIPNFSILKYYKEMIAKKNNLFLVSFSDNPNETKNRDAVEVLNKISQILKSSTEISPIQTFLDFMSYLTEIGVIYSSFSEILFSHMYLTSENPIKFWRYDSGSPIIKKVGIRTLSRVISPLLGLLYQPNKHSILDPNIEQNDLQSNSIYEKIWLNNF